MNESTTRRCRGESAMTRVRADAAYEILEAIQPASVRAVCYQLFVRKLIPNMSKSSTNAISRMLRIEREEGAIPWEWIVDESRSPEGANRWSDTNAIISAAVRGYRRDYWQDQDFRVEVWAEKGTVRGTLGPVLDAYGVTFRVMHGYASATVINDIANLSNSSKKPLIALYVGDWDPSGKHMSDVDLPERLARYGADVCVRRVALLENDLSSLPSFDLESKASDPRHSWFRECVGGPCYELDAMSPPVMRSRVEDEICDWIDFDLWDHAKFVEQVEINSMQDFHKSWQATIRSGAAPAI